MIITIGNTKGGVGKTTLAVNLASIWATAGKDVLLVDGDDQQTALTFTALRAEECGQAGYTAVSLTGILLRDQVRQLAPKYDIVVIDVGGRDTGSLRAALVVTQLVLIPVQPRTFDIWGAEHMAHLLKEAAPLNAALRAYAVLNAADAQGRDNQEAAAVLQSIEGMKLLPLRIGRRKAYSNAQAHGRSILEHLPRDPKALAEFTALVRALEQAGQKG